MNANRKKKRINIIRWDNNLGLSRDAEIITRILERAGFEVSLYPFCKPSRRYSLLNLLSGLTQAKPLYDINLFIEDILPDWLPFARVNCLIPNQEWFRQEAEPYLSQIDWVLCKTKHAQEIFTQLDCQTQFISFTGSDRFNFSIPKNDLSFFHLSTSPQKGTNALIEVWKTHPEWPNLTIIQSPKYAQLIVAQNINYHPEYLSCDKLHYYQNSHSIHLCPSKSEGFGHSLIEAMSCQAVVLTTNAPPMNELITSERGILVNYSETSVQRLGTSYSIDKNDLEQKIEQILGMSSQEIKCLGEKAREWYLYNDQFFKRHFIEVLKNL